ncbi:diphthine-ammonia ligase [Geosmithia morbida]|uniref:Diphthine--ammonia ligase n=1 Tax=Geosmithia morbida TaxID=1094350 RepID=A0A9P4YXG5_9HYPO|nr:diphthine-ammonia ligase [Geosmithia morbida]KAF4123521.1 diphthine-ammonia ligase [Geosmithia morbida]
MAGDGLGVIALISGGKDSFFSLLHCIRQGHKVVALANLLPASEATSTGVQVIDPSAPASDSAVAEDVAEDASATASDLNSFMYQTVGHEVIPLYAAATGLPLYRQAIRGGAQRHELEYAGGASDEGGDETESMTTLLREVMRRHPEANAVSAGAILSTYQRTRVESVALRLGLVPLAYLWKYPVLPPPADSPGADDGQLLKDMALAGLDARLIKVASAGLSEDDLWERVSSTAGADRVKAALRRFGAAGGAVLGEGGEFETIVIDGPPELFRKRISVAPERRRTVHEGGGTTWLVLHDAASLEDKPQESAAASPPRVPDLFDAGFQAILDRSTTTPTEHPGPGTRVSSALLGTLPNKVPAPNHLLQWSVFATDGGSVEAETADVVSRIRHLLSSRSLDASQISNTVVILRRMSDFPAINAKYGQLFARPNPPSRVTVSCGDLLPADRSIAVYLTVDTTPSGTGMDRRGLHVQSRSYWAPANIGPYSQAVGVAATTASSGPRSWSVAGQIPLVPSSMELPGPSGTSRQTQIVLSLQHLWRIGRDLDIQLWTSAVALFARSASDEEMQRNSALAGQAWRLAHGSPRDDDDDDDEAGGGPDLWDLKYNPKYMSLAGGAGQRKQAETPLPDWETMTLDQQNDAETCVPPVFSVEVEELPKQAAVEWQAHVGLSQVDDSSVEMLYQATIQGGHAGWKAWHIVARGADDAVYLHTTLAKDLDAPGDLGHIQQDMASTYEDALRELDLGGGDGNGSGVQNSSPYLAYIDADKVGSPWKDATTVSEPDGLAWMPCRSIWSPDGTRLAVISVYRMTVT